ncbi:DMT family protein [Bdellovibrio sp. SKB1291214]|uniref:DMT family protein n=1 Tax=Bdellovibrio sp. SKB1291214 TaxID=1732569 RepID=UPI0022406243|nr:DMT family protein [Bdellovibrio sp. SKB1291214]UYL08340.1 DMT family protein [Bdellovibrio sp. SKB1291214]
MLQYISPIALLLVSNIFMTFAWYGHLKSLKSSALWIAIAVSWGIALFEYIFQVPANRMGSEVYTLPQLKVIQEVITMVVFAGFSYWYMGQPLKIDYLYAGLCLVGAVYFLFR